MKQKFYGCIFLDLIIILFSSINHTTKKEKEKILRLGRLRYSSIFINPIQASQEDLTPLLKHAFEEDVFLYTNKKNFITENSYYTIANPNPKQSTINCSKELHVHKKFTQIQLTKSSTHQGKNKQQQAS